MRILLSLLAFVFASSSLSAQTFDDALRFSENNALGTARSLGTANSMSAIGADWTALQSNPAGLAAFRNNEVTVTLGGLLTGTADATLSAFAGATDAPVGSVMSTNDGSGFRVALPQIGLVFTKEPIASRWTQVNFGIGFSQKNRFEENIRFEGATPGSITDWFLETANDYYSGNPLSTGELNDFDNGLAYDAGILVPSDGTSTPAEYSSDYDDFGRTSNTDPGVALYKQGDVARKGYNSSLDISLGGNYDEKLLIGATLSLVNTSFEETNVYIEEDKDDAVDAFERLRYVRTFSQEGTGVSGKFGAIYRLSQAFRVGLAYHSPSVISITENNLNSITYTYLNTAGAGVQGSGTTPGENLPFEHTFVSPSTYRASAAYVIGRRGFISADLGFINYAGAKFKVKDDRTYEETINGIISENAVSALDAHVGAEMNVNPFKIRVGFEYAGAPVNGEDASLGFSGGIGFRQNRLSADLGYRLSIRPDRVYRPYTVDFQDFPQQYVDYTPTISTMALTVGWKLMPRAYED